MFTHSSVHCCGCALQRRIVAQNIKRLKDIGCYRGRRHIMVRSTACSIGTATIPADAVWQPDAVIVACSLEDA
jgi:hypothetical protein